MPDTFQTMWRLQPGPALLASRDRTSGEIAFPPLPPTSPLAPRHETIALATDGVVYSHTVIHPNPKSGQAPHALAYVVLPGPVRLFGRFVDGQRPRIGSRCRVVPHDVLGYAFETAGEGA
jgi:uncharacterized OB-fold protein